MPNSRQFCYLKWSSYLDNIFYSLGRNPSTALPALQVNYAKLIGAACIALMFSCCHFQQ